jgi:glycosyltransferase involved in cell wall biosynthesis
MSRGALRLLLLVHNVAYTGGGTFYRALSLGHHLARRGHTVSLICSAAAGWLRVGAHPDGGVLRLESAGLLPVRWRYGYDLAEAMLRRRWVRQQGGQFDIVHAFDSRPTVIYPALAAQRLGAKLVMDWCDWFGRGGAVEERPNPVMRALLRPVETYYEERFRLRAARTTVINRALEARARQLGVAPPTILRLPSGADPQRIGPLEREAARRATGLPAEATLLGYLGSLFPADAALLADALQRLRQARSPVELVRIGRPQAALRLPGVRAIGYVDDVRLGQYLSACDVLLLPMVDSVANRGRWPSKLMDYFAAGRPTVGCAVGDVGEVLTDSAAGLACAPSPEAFADAILHLLDSPAEQFRLGQAARQAAEGPYNWRVLAQQVEGLYRSSLEAG